MTSHNEKFEREFEAFLTEEQSRLAVLYRKLPQAEPDAKLDAAVLAMARRNAVDATGASRTYKPRRRWLPALGAAACAVLAAGIALRLGPTLRNDHDATGASTNGAISAPPHEDSAPMLQLSRSIPPAGSTTGAPAPASPSLDDAAKSAAAPPLARAKATSQIEAADNRPVAVGELSKKENAVNLGAQPQAFPAQASENKRETDALERKQTVTPGTQQMLHKLDSGSAAANMTRAAPAAAAAASPTRQAPVLLHRGTLAAPPPPSAPATAVAPTQAQAESSSNMARDQAPMSAAGGAAQKKSMQSQDPNASLYPEHWLANIRILLRENRREEALRSLEKFRKTYPDYQLPEDLRELK